MLIVYQHRPSHRNIAILSMIASACGLEIVATSARHRLTGTQSAHLLCSWPPLQCSHSHHDVSGTLCRTISRPHHLCQFSVAARRPTSPGVHSLDCCTRGACELTVITGHFNPLTTSGATWALNVRVPGCQKLQMMA